jgi:quinol monooxygenase YgiN
MISGVPRVPALLVSLIVTLPATAGQAQVSAPADTTFFAVSYVEARPAEAKTAGGALTRYRAASRTQTGFLQADVFEQIGRPGHFAIVEVWRDRETFDARDPSAQRGLLAELEPIRVSGYDQRPYKPLSTASGRPSTDSAVVFVVSHVDVAPNSQAPALLRRLAEASRQEDGNLRFDVVQHMMRANHFTVIEAWRNQQALDAHVAADHTRQYRDELQGLTGSPLDERVYSAVD